VKWIATTSGDYSLSVWRNISVREEQKEMLDELKNKKQKKTGKEPSYSEILDEMFEGSKVKEKREEKRDFLEIF